MLNYVLSFSILLGIIFTSCDDKNKTYNEIIERERNERSAYLKENNITLENLLPEGVYYQELYSTNNPQAKQVEIGDNAIIYYTGHYVDGRVFDTNVLSGKYEPLIVNITGKMSGQVVQQGGKVANVIAGWIPVLLKMKEGTKARAIIPSSIVYGSYIYNSDHIEKFKTLIFEIEVYNVRKKATIR